MKIFLSKTESHLRFSSIDENNFMQTQNVPKLQTCKKKNVCLKL